MTAITSTAASCRLVALEDSLRQLSSLPHDRCANECFVIWFIRKYLKILNRMHVPSWSSASCEDDGLRPRGRVHPGGYRRSLERTFVRRSPHEPHNPPGS